MNSMGVPGCCQEVWLIWEELAAAQVSLQRSYFSRLRLAAFCSIPLSSAIPTQPSCANTLGFGLLWTCKADPADELGGS